MNIAVDIDGVLTNIETFMKEEGEKYFKKEVVNQYGDDIDSLFGVSKESSKEFWDSTFFDYTKDYPARPNCGEVLSKLGREGNNIYIVTARDYKCNYGFKDEQHLRNITESFLNTHGVKHDGLFFYPSPKLDAVKDLNIDVFIEDDPSNITSLAKVTNVIAFNTSYNKHINGPKVSRANDWLEIYDIIKTLERK